MAKQANSPLFSQNEQNKQINQRRHTAAHHFDGDLWHIALNDVLLVGVLINPKVAACHV